MQRGMDQSGGLGPQLVGEKISVNRRNVSVLRQLGEGGFSFVYLVKDISEDENINNNTTSNNSNNDNLHHHHLHHQSQTQQHMVLKITSIHSRQQRDIAEKEAKLLSRLSHPSIVRMMDSCYRNSNNNNPMNNNFDSSNNNQNNNNHHSRHQHLILMEYCDGGTALSVCNNLKTTNKQFDLPNLIIAFGQICNAVSYLHAQRPPIVHRDLKPVNFLVKNGAYKLCDFGSAVFGHVDLRTSRARSEAEEVIQKTTTQMFRSPEMVDLYMSKKLTQSTDVWALGCCLYSLAFIQNCFEEGSNLAILSRNYKIPEDNPYGSDLVELIDRMLTVNCKERADMTEVILCLSAIYSGKPLPPRKRESKKEGESGNKEKQEKKERVGTYRTDGQGIRKTFLEEKKPAEAKKLNPNSAAARRRKAAEEGSSGGGVVPSIPFTRQLSLPLNTKMKQTKYQQKPKIKNLGDFREPFGGNTSLFKSPSGGSFSASDDPFQIGEDRTHNPTSFFGSKDSGTDSSHDWGGDFSSENGSGFDNFGSSDDGSRSAGFGTSAATFLKTISSSEQQQSKEINASSSPSSFPQDGIEKVKFSSFSINENKHDFRYEEGFEATYNDNNKCFDDRTGILADINEAGQDSDIQKRKKKVFKGFFTKGEKIKHNVV
mmetsp:Transcript_32956/g.38356  ORF Transcript_32956/g.38356 Transcript_32956/m.38356 type:complete len:654 (+) Transcript_32956:408-2369(+)